MCVWMTVMSPSTGCGYARGSDRPRMSSAAEPYRAFSLMRPNLCVVHEYVPESPTSIVLERIRRLLHPKDELVLQHHRQPHYADEGALLGARMATTEVRHECAEQDLQRSS